MLKLNKIYFLTVATIFCWYGANHVNAADAQNPEATSPTRAVAASLPRFDAPVEQLIEQYLSSARFIKCRPDLRAPVETGMRSCIAANQGRWTGGDDLGTKEQFYWNLFHQGQASYDDKLIQTLFSAPVGRLDWRRFQDFSTPYLPEPDEDPVNNIGLEDAKDCRLAAFFQIYTSYSNASERQEVIEFCISLFGEPNGSDCLSDWDSFSGMDGATRRDFLEFCKSFLPINIDANHLYETYRDLANSEARKDFSVLWQFFMREINANDDDDSIKIGELYKIYQAFPDTESRQDFALFCKPYGFYYLIVNDLLTIYWDDSLKQILPSFSKPHKGKASISRFLPRTYLGDERALAALAAENNPDEARVQAVYETGSGYLPPVFVEDPLVQELINRAGVANAHDFDALYLGEFDLLRQQTSALGYVDTLSRPFTRFNIGETIENYCSNAQVEEFLTYLGDFKGDVRVDGGKVLSADRAISLVQQMLGVAPKTARTRGPFTTYLGSTMLYAQADSPLGDDVLGRAWFLVKKRTDKIISDACEGDDETQDRAWKDAENYKRSIILAILESAEMNGDIAETHCQTRITGEIFKATSWHLDDSRIRRYIASDDPIDVRSDADLRARILLAPEKAKMIFSALKDGSHPIVRDLFARDDAPELFEYYRAFYDGLYRRTLSHSERDGTLVYAKDEHILTRDDRGNLVKLYHSDKTLRENPEIVYYQAEFQVLEKAFTELMRHEFEEQRGSVY